ncbi:hypothetical protein E2C01_059976 [Portunus trituberculatus]|uniref:Uncharacterized protein n=1 Tax=Portunus trituberculatus TaxID=210409 RepID=A0A5B7H0Z8_PORTR|nr:hypothetical protein [Portunus trituberculatus]
MPLCRWWTESSVPRVTSEQGTDVSNLWWTRDICVLVTGRRTPAVVTAAALCTTCPLTTAGSTLLE